MTKTIINFILILVGVIATVSDGFASGDQMKAQMPYSCTVNNSPCQITYTASSGNPNAMTFSNGWIHFVMTGGPNADGYNASFSNVIIYPDKKSDSGKYCTASMILASAWLDEKNVIHPATFSFYDLKSNGGINCSIDNNGYSNAELHIN
jgi:hypothetical protein